MPSEELVNAQKLVQQASAMVERLERGVLGDATTLEAMIARAQMSLNELVLRSGNRAVGSLSPLEVKRAESLLSECGSLQGTVDRAKKRAAKEVHLRTQREQLMGSASAAYFNRADDNDAALLAREGQSLAHSRTKVKHLVEESHAVLSALRGQGQQVAGSGQKLGDIMEALGVSNHTILAIVRTNRVDTWLVYIGIVLMLMLMWYLWFR